MAVYICVLIVVRHVLCICINLSSFLQDNMELISVVK